MFVRLRRGFQRLVVSPLRPILGSAVTGAAMGAVIGAGAAGPAIAEPALWKVEGPAETIYLFGTVHVLKPGLAWRSQKIDRALKASGSLWLEIADPDDAAGMQPLVAKYGFDPAHPLSSRLDPATRARLDAVLTGLGVSPARWEAMRPWMAGLALDVLPLGKAGYDADSGVERVIKQEAVGAAKPVEGFETAEEQIRLLADAPEADQIEVLKSSLDDAEKGVAEIDALVGAWAAGDEGAIEAHMNGDMRKDYPALYQRLIVERNHRFAARIAELACNGETGDYPASPKGVVFVAVGAAHLVGPDSVEAFLAKQGLDAVRQ
jgi:uncharacterized protein YbaP (TraB family)